MLRGEMGEPSEQLAEMQALLREVKQRSALWVLGGVIGLWSHAKTVQMEKWLNKHLTLLLAGTPRS